jgi:starch synthase
MSKPQPINVLFLASEADPLIKVGGLGDVAGSLPRALRKINSLANHQPVEVDARLAIPFHRGIRVNPHDLQPVAEYWVHSTRQDFPVRVFEVHLEGLPVYLIDGAPIEQASNVYSSNLEADGFKYTFFSQAALLLPRQLGWSINILHANDWHTSAAVYSLALIRPTDPFFRHTASLLTIHNLPYLGSTTSSALAAFELPPAENTSLPHWASHMALPLGLLTADAVVAVSPGYAKEILTDEFGAGLSTFLKAHAKKITGILNGLDTQRWDPANDSELKARYTAAECNSRQANKIALQAELELPRDPGIPLVSMITRMDHQKGVDLAVEALRRVLELPLGNVPPLQAVLLGTGDPALEVAARRLEQDNPDLVRARITYNERLSRHIYAGADMLLMPSRYEPCGLSQMIAMRYGCVPVAHATGGLSDTIHDPIDTDESTGFLFKPPTAKSLAEAIQRALVVYRHTPDLWRDMQIRGMQQDFSWDRSAAEYLELYKKLLDFHSRFGNYV